LPLNKSQRRLFLLVPRIPRYPRPVLESAEIRNDSVRTKPAFLNQCELGEATKDNQFPQTLSDKVQDI
jgi:hypothetical protein